MSYLVLARKWRPHSFQAMVGQQHVLQALINALTHLRLHHAYLFTGGRGVGKTSTARILAKCLNCEAGISATPCGECQHCVAIDAGRHVDVIEVDAASRTKVEDTRELLNNVQYAPTQARFKVYIIDEVHMLTGHSFNALLKTLEEPPEHVKFLLATTDPQKLPATVLSRCLQFHLKNLLPEQILAHLQMILKEENIPAEEAALWQIAHAAQGSLRDALSLLDQAIAFSNNHITEAAMRDMLGSIEQSQIQQLLQALLQRDATQVFQCCEQFSEMGIDFANALASVLSLLHDIALAQKVPATLEANTANQTFIATMAQQISPQDVQLFYQIGLIGRRDLSLAPSPRQGFEMCLLRMLAFQPAATASKPEAIATETTPVVPTAAKAPEPEKKTPHVEPAPPPQVEIASKAAEPSPQPAHQSARFDSVQDWQAILPQLKLSGMSLALANNANVSKFSDDRIELTVNAQHASLIADSAKSRIEKALCDCLGKPIQLKFSVAEETIETPAALDEAKSQAILSAAEHAIEQDPNVQAIIERFDAIIAPGSVKATESSS